MELKKYKLGEICPEFHAGNGIQSSQIKGSGLYPVFGGNGLRGYTDTFNQDGQYLIIGRQGAYCGNVRYNGLFCNLVEKDSLDERIPLVSVVL